VTGENDLLKMRKPHLTLARLLLVVAAGHGSPPVLVEHPADVLVARDLPATLRCEARADPRPTITWVKDGVVVTTAPSDPNSHRVLLPAGHLFFLRAVRGKRDDDRGTYWCKASNSEGEVTSRKATLDIGVLRGEFPEEPLDTWVARREEVELPCTLPEGHPPPRVSWRKDGTTLNITDKVRSMRIRCPTSAI